MTITDADSAVWSYDYTSPHLLADVTDPNYLTNAVGYSAAHRAASASLADGSSRVLTPLVTMGLATGIYGTTSHPAPVTLAAAAYAEFDDGNSSPWWTQFDWAGFGSPVQAIAPDGGDNLAYRDTNDLAWLTADPLARRTRAFYDSLANPTKTVSADDTYSQATYNSFSEPLTVTDANGHTTTFAYDSDGNNTSITDANGHVTTQTFTTHGYLSTTTDPLSHTITYGYDSRDRLTSVTDALSHTVTFAYDSASDKTSTTDALSHASSATYDAMNRPLTTTDALSGVTTFTYDPVGNLFTLTDPDSNTTTYFYDGLNRVAVEDDPLAQDTAYVHDGNGNVTSVTDRNGQLRTFDYDLENRRVDEVWWSGDSATYVAYYSYDVAGQLLSAQDDNSEYAYTYDSLGRLTSDDNTGTTGVGVIVLSYTYDAAGNRASVSDNLGAEVDSTYTNTNQLATLKMYLASTLGPNVAFTYDNADRETAATRKIGTTGATVSTAFSYDNANRSTEIAHTSSTAGALSDFTYGYDAANRITSYTGPDGSLSYTLDSTDQLTAVSGSHSESYSFDANGNRTMSGYTTGAGNQLTSDGTYSYTYDNEGNTLTKSKSGEYWTFTYDARNRLIEATKSAMSGGSATYDAVYTYDVFDRRIGVNDDGTQTSTAYDGANAWADFDDAGEVEGSSSHGTTDSGPVDFDAGFAMRYLNGPGMDERYARVDVSGNVGWYLTDNINSVRQIVNTSGTVLYAAAYSAFGVIRTQTGTGGDRFKYTGREWDAGTGQYYYRARYYGAGVGRFSSEDSFRFAAGDVNLYRYVRNSSITSTDLSGHWSLGKALFAAAVAIAIVVVVVVAAPIIIGVTVPTAIAVSGAAGAGVLAGLKGGDAGTYSEAGGIGFITGWVHGLAILTWVSVFF